MTLNPETPIWFTAWFNTHPTLPDQISAEAAWSMTAALLDTGITTQDITGGALAGALALATASSMDASTAAGFAAASMLQFGFTAPNPTQSWHRGDWMQTYTGRKFYPLDPKVEDIDPIDIAHSLSLQCRYNGHVDRFYSVAEHCVLMSFAVPEEAALWALLHDATEAYVGDMIRPLKRSMPDYVLAEDQVMKAICERWDLPSLDMPASVKDADDRILLTERAALMSTGAPQPWGQDGLEPLPVTVTGWEPAAAQSAYLERLAQLTGETTTE